MVSSPMRCALALTALSATVAGCGGESTAPKPREQLTISLENFKGGPKVKATPTIRAGVVRMRFTNKTTTGRYSAQIIRVDPGHDVLAALKEAEAWGDQGKPLPTWIHMEGGFGAVEPGVTLTGVAKFVAGNYAVVENSSGPEPDYATFAVKGEASDEPVPSTPSTIKAMDYAFKAKGLRIGASFRFDNAGNQPHSVSFARLQPGATPADALRALTTRARKSPVDQSTAVSSGVLDPGTSQVLNLGLPEPGRYVLMCLVRDRQGGPAHAFKGMVAQAVVK